MNVVSVLASFASVVRFCCLHGVTFVFDDVCFICCGSKPLFINVVGYVAFVFAAARALLSRGFLGAVSATVLVSRFPKWFTNRIGNP